MSTHNSTQDRAVLVLELRPSRRKARALALAEVCSVLEDFNCTPATGGPRSEVKGTAWAMIDPAAPTHIAAAIPHLGYSRRVEIVQSRDVDAEPDETTVRWRRRPIDLIPVYEESDAKLRERSPDKRLFRLECKDGIVRTVQGYRGGRGPLERRALPPSDARLLVNLLGPAASRMMLDPFAGGGGIAVEALDGRWHVATTDIDRTLRFGLSDLGCYHTIADATRLPFASESLDGIATEPPYDETADSVVARSVTEFHRVLKRGAKCSLMFAARQQGAISKIAIKTGFEILLSSSVDRNGTEVVVELWRR